MTEHAPSTTPQEYTENNIQRIVDAREMFQLPNKPELDREAFSKRVEELQEQYQEALKDKEKRVAIRTRITTLLNEKHTSNTIDELVDILQKYPDTAVPHIVYEMRYVPEEYQVGIAYLALKATPQKSAPELAKSIPFLEEQETQDAVAQLLLEKAPEAAAENLAETSGFLSEKMQEKVFYTLIEKAPQKAIPNLTKELPYFKTQEQVRFATLLLQKDPQRATLPLIKNLNSFKKEYQNKIINLLLHNTPRTHINILAENIASVSEDEVLTTFPLLTCRSMPVEDLNVVLLVRVSKLINEVPSFARLAESVPPVTAMLALTPLLVSMATVRSASIEKFDLLVPESA